MITKGGIEQTLKNLERLYNNSRGTITAEYYSKMALLECCGWIEQSMDDIVARCVKRNIREASIVKRLTEEIERNYSFTYAKHFRKTLTYVIGEIVFLKVEKGLNRVDLDRLAATLGTLKKERDDAAHTHMRGTLKTIDTPSIFLQKLNVIYPILVSFDRELRRLGY